MMILSLFVRLILLFSFEISRFHYLQSQFFMDFRLFVLLARLLVRSFVHKCCHIYIIPLRSHQKRTECTWLSSSDRDTELAKRSNRIYPTGCLGDTVLQVFMVYKLVITARISNCSFDNTICVRFWMNLSMKNFTNCCIIWRLGIYLEICERRMMHSPRHVDRHVAEHGAEETPKTRRLENKITFWHRSFLNFEINGLSCIFKSKIHEWK